MSIEPDEMMTNRDGTVCEDSSIRDGETGELRHLGSAEVADQHDGVVLELQAIDVEFLSDERAVTDEEEITTRITDDGAAACATKALGPVIGAHVFAGCRVERSHT